MKSNALETFVTDVRARWGALDTALAQSARAALATLASAPTDEPWLAALHAERPASHELYRDPEHGFVLLAHTEGEGLYRPPHDHGRGWVIYALQEGEIEIATYARIEDHRGVSLVERERSALRAGEARLYLPGDVHDTRCTRGPALLLRFTERDLRREEQVERALTRYMQRDGRWTTPL